MARIPAANKPPVLLFDGVTLLSLIVDRVWKTKRLTTSWRDKAPARKYIIYKSALKAKGQGEGEVTA
jgi:hypothetical protein